jgi:hypothetical protein
MLLVVWEGVHGAAALSIRAPLHRLTVFVLLICVLVFLQAKAAEHAAEMEAAVAVAAATEAEEEDAVAAAAASTPQQSGKKCPARLGLGGTARCPGIWRRPPLRNRCHHHLSRSCHHHRRVWI